MKFCFEDFSTEVDNTDVKTVKRYEECLEEFYKRVARIDMKGSASGIYSAICDAGEKMMNDFFGNGAAEDMFGESQSVRKLMTAVCGLNRFMNDVGGVIDEMRAVGE